MEVEDETPTVDIALSSRVLWGQTVAEAAATAWQLGYQGLEIWAEHAWRDGGLKTLCRQLRRVGVRYILHGPFMDLNLCSRNPRVARLSLAENVRALSWACSLEASLMVVHPGRLSSSRDDPEEYWPILAETLGELGRRATELGVTLAVENMEPRPREFMVRPSDSRRLFRSLSDEGIGMCLDLAHAARLGMEMPDEFIEELGTTVCHVHVSNICGERAHLPMDEGLSPLTPNVLRFLRSRFSGMATVEGGARPGMDTAVTGLAHLAELLGRTKGVRAGTTRGRRESRHGSEACYGL